MPSQMVSQATIEAVRVRPSSNWDTVAAIRTATVSMSKFSDSVHSIYFSQKGPAHTIEDPREFSARVHDAI